MEENIAILNTPQVPRGVILSPAQIKVGTSVGHFDRLNNVRSTIRKPHFLSNKELFSESPQPSADTDCPPYRESTSSPIRLYVNKCEQSLIARFSSRLVMYMYTFI